MRRLWTVGAVLMAGVFAACGSSDGSSPSGGTGGFGAGGTGGAFGGTGGGTGGSTSLCPSTFTASGTATPATGDPIEIALNQPDGVQVVSGDSGNTRFEALYASDKSLEKAYLGPDYALLIDILDSDSDSLQSATYTQLGSHGATLSVKYEEGMWHSFTLELDASKGDFVTIEDGTTPLYEVVMSPQVKASYQLSFKSYTDMNGTTVDATGTLTGRFDGCYMRDNDQSGKYQE